MQDMGDQAGDQVKITGLTKRKEILRTGNHSIHNPSTSPLAAVPVR